MKTSTFVWIVVAVVLVGGIIWYVSAPATTPATQEAGGAAAGTIPEGSGQEVGPADEPLSTTPTSASVTLGASGFSPQEVIVKKGGTVTWSNEGSGTMWVASAQHPTHTGYAGTSLQEHCDDATDVSFDQCKNGETYSFTFDKVGTWAYHNHSQGGQFGRVIVVE